MKELFLIVLGVGLLMFLVVSCESSLGVDGFGPYRSFDATVTRTYVDHHGESSSYMVATDKGVFEVDNGVMLGMWNADKVYGSIREGRKYHFTTKGNEHANMFMQDYPYVVKAEAAER